jgi:hypothetical protein
MRICYNNQLEEANNLSMTNLESGSYVSNLYHPYLELAANCTSVETVITGSWTDSTSVNSIAVGYHNASFCHVVMYDIDSNVICDNTFTLETYDSIYYDCEVKNAYGFSLTFTGGEPIYIGYVFIGEYQELPGFDIGGSFDYEIRSQEQQSLAGQRYGVFYKPLKGFKITWARLTNNDRMILLDFAAAVQTVKGHMVDFFPDSHDEEPPCYVCLDKSLDITKRDESYFYYKITATWKEAR